MNKLVKTHRKAISWLLLALIFFTTMPLAAQMDLLPFIFRDIPPELEQGIPMTMTYQDFRDLNRNVDFFTVGMSMIVPGYGYFQVGKPAAGWAIAGGRIAGYGLMAAGVIRQWDDFRDIWNGSEISSDAWNELKINSFMFGAGAGINIILWGLDVLGAYHVAIEEKNWVIYHYGLTQERESLNRPEIEQLRFYFSQTDPITASTLRARLYQIVNSGVSGDFDPLHFQEASYYHAVMEYGRGNHERAVASILAAFEAPDNGWSYQLGNLGISILSSSRAENWGEDRAILWETFGAASRGETGLVELAQLLPRLTHRGLITEFRILANRYLASSGLPSEGDKVLEALALSWEGESQIELAAQAYAKLVRFYPYSGLAEQSRTRAMELFSLLGNELAVAALREL